MEEVKKLVAENNLLFGTIDTWLLYKLTKGKVHATDYSNISATGLWDPFIMDWNQFGIKLLGGIPLSILPKVCDTAGEFGKIDPFIFGVENQVEIPILAICADNHASMFGQCAFNPGDTKCTLGTGSFMTMNVGNQSYASKHGLYPLIGWKIQDEIVFLLEADAKNSGDVVEWITQIDLLDDISKSSLIAQSVPDSNGVYFFTSTFWIKSSLFG